MQAFLCGCVLVMAALLPAAGGAATPQDAVTGTWLTDEGDSRVAVAASGDGVAGKVVWLKTPARDGQPLRDANNSDPALRDRPIMGLEILSGFKPAPGGGWTGGSVYSPRAGKSYPADLALAPDGRLQIKVKAGLITKTLYWTR